MSVGQRLRIALPWVLAVALTGGLVGMLFGNPASGFRAGAVLGGVAAFLHIRRRTRNFR